MSPEPVKLSAPGGKASSSSSSQRGGRGGSFAASRRGFGRGRGASRGGGGARADRGGGAGTSAATSAGGASSAPRRKKLRTNLFTGKERAAAPEFKAPLSQDDTPPKCDEAACATFVYPSNFPRREYQLSIVRKALMKNTLVCLPTGLGKTFIAAVVMYNFYRWFPESKIVFMAPMKPLVQQQHVACYQTMGVPQDEIVVLVGNVNTGVRRPLWQQKRVFFVTPQVWPTRGMQ